MINRSMDDVMMLRIQELCADNKLNNEAVEDLYHLDLSSNRTLRLEEIDLLNEILTPASPELTS